MGSKKQRSLEWPIRELDNSEKLRKAGITIESSGQTSKQNEDLKCFEQASYILKTSRKNKLLTIVKC